MKMWKSILLAGGALFAFAAAAQAADLPTRKGAPVAPPAANCYATFWTWFDASAKDCPLSYWGVTFYGTIDVGGGYSTNASRFNSAYPNGVQEFISKTSHGGAWQGIPSGLSQSNVGIKWKERIVADWYVIGDVNFGFDPYSLTFANGPKSLIDQNNVPGFNQSSNGDSSRTYGPINTRAYAGIENKTFGALTYGRQYAFSNDLDNNYDPSGGSYAFSLIGTSGTIGGGLGDTELARYNNSIKYEYKDHGIHAGVLSQVGGYSAGNNAQYAIQGVLGFEYQGLSVDGVYSYAKDAVSLGTLNSLLLPNDLKATIQNITAGQIGAKYNWKQFTVYGGYQIDQIGNPSDLPVGTFFRDFNGGYQAEWGTGAQGVDAYPKDKILQIGWFGAKWAVLKNVDLIGAYYHLWQNDYLGSTETFGGAAASCAPNTGANPLGGTLKGTNNSKCAGYEDAVSGLVDWKPFKRLDVYGGVTYSKVNGGLASGYYADNNVLTMAGVRLNF